MSKVIENIIEFITPIATSLGYEVVDVEFKKLYDSKNLFIYIDKPEGICLDDCELMHKAVDEPLDELDPTNGEPYILNISSPGLDRPFKTQKDFDKHMNKEVEVKLYKTYDKCKKIEAILRGFDGEIVNLEYKNNNININFKDIAVIRAVIKF